MTLGGWTLIFNKEFFYHQIIYMGTLKLRDLILIFNEIFLSEIYMVGICLHLIPSVYQL